MDTSVPSLRRLLVAAALCGSVVWAHAAALIANGGFEAGFSSWTQVDQLGSEGGFAVQSGTLSPVNGDPVPAPTAGLNAAMSDAGGPGAHVLYQDFVVPAGHSGMLSFDLFIGNRGPFFATPATLNFAGVAINQRARVDIMLASADPFSLLAGDILMAVYETAVGDALVSGYTTISRDVSALFAAREGQTLRLRFAETDNLAPLQMGIDNVGIEAVPAPGTAVLAALALALMVALRRRMRTGRAARWTRVLALGALGSLPLAARADSIPVQMLDPELAVETVLNSGLSQPIGMTFLGSVNDYFVIEKASGQVKRVLGGVLQATPVLDLAVNSNSERGLLSLVLHPNFPGTPYVYVRWTESSTGVDSTVVSETPLLGNRVDRFIWNGSALVFDINLARFRALQTDNIAVPGHPGTNNANQNGNHNGGVMRFGPDGKLYIYIGDLGRRGWLQNLANGPFLTAPQVDDTFGGPAPDNAHLSGVILRLNDDGTTPADNPFFAAGQALGGEVGANVQKIFSYGHRNGFGMAFDPASGWLWETENADDAYAEINRVVPGLNGGWIQFAGPASRVQDWKLIETTQFGRALQQVRYPPTRAAYNATVAMSRLVMLPGAVYKDPELSWRYEVGPSGTTFVQGNALGAGNAGTLWIGSARAFAQVGGTGGSLYRLRLSADRLHLDLSADPRLADRVADNLFRAQKFEGTESETMIVGRGFGVTPSIEQGPDGLLYVVSLSDNTIYRIRPAAVPQ
jgi:glucose/arabinose dehydrogenase